jgi:hypothetical protein
METVKVMRLVVLCVLIAAFSSVTLIGQTNERYSVLGESELEKIVPTSFYFAGQSAPTQMRNAAAAKLGKDRFVIVGMVDTSGYSAEISGKYEGFFITDSPIRIGNRDLNPGAYGFGFTQRGTMNILQLNATRLLTVPAPADRRMERPRPLQMTASRNGVRLYHGRNFVLISAR